MNGVVLDSLRSAPDKEMPSSEKKWRIVGSMTIQGISAATTTTQLQKAPGFARYGAES